VAIAQNQCVGIDGRGDGRGSVCQGYPEMGYEVFAAHLDTEISKGADVGADDALVGVDQREDRGRSRQSGEQSRS